MRNKNIQLFIIPYAGGNTFSFKNLVDNLADDIDVITVEYAGRGNRIHEKFSTNFGEMMEDVSNFIESRRKKEISCSIMGYSMGSVLAYEILRRKKISGVVQHLFISAQVSPADTSFTQRKIPNPIESNILKRIRQLGGVNEKLLEDKRFKKIYIDPMIRDFQNFMGYEFEEGGDKIEIDTTFFYCDNDTAAKAVHSWERLINGKLDFYEYGENHFFVNQYYKEMAYVINSHISKFNNKQ